ncbi:hypothetical protein ACROYT_G007455 [Oculina patagonica]
MTVIQCYASTNDADPEQKDIFYETLQAEVENTDPSQDLLVVMGDLNAMVGTVNTGNKRFMGGNGYGILNDNGERFVELCGMNNLVIGGTLFLTRTYTRSLGTLQTGATSPKLTIFSSMGNGDDPCKITGGHKYCSHTETMELGWSTSISKVALRWTPEDKRKRGRQKSTWRRTAEAELQALNLTWEQASRLAKDRQEWRRLVNAICATGRLKDLTQFVMAGDPQNYEDILISSQDSSQDLS